MRQVTKNNILFSALFTSVLAPMIFFVMGLPMILQLKGFDASIIGFFQLANLPVVFKFLISPLVDKIKFKKNHYKKWILYTGILYIFLLIFIAFLSFENDLYTLFIAILLSSFVSTFIDIPINALAIKVFKKEERVSAGSYKAVAYSFAALLGGGVFLLFYNYLGWKITLFLMAFFLFISLLALYFIDENSEIVETNSISFKNILTFFRQEDIGIWIFILSFYFVSISAIWVFMKPYLISKGVNADDVAIYVGIYGSFVAILGGFLANFIGQKFEKKSLLLIFMAFNILSVAILILIELNSFSFYYLLFSITMFALAISLSSATIYSIIMDYCSINTRAIDYSIQSSIFALTRIASAFIAAMVVSNFGFLYMFIFELFIMIIVFFVIYKKYRT